MIKYEIVRKKPAFFLHIFGLSISEFDSVVGKVGSFWKEKITGGYKRPGRDCKLSKEEMIMVILLYYKNYVTQKFVGMLFNINAATVCRIIKRLEPILLEIIALPERNGLSSKELRELIPNSINNDSNT
jgi:hypothetical protein